MLKAKFADALQTLDSLDRDEAGWSFLEGVMAMALAATIGLVTYKVFWEKGGSISIQDKVGTSITGLFNLFTSSGSSAK